MRIEGVMEPIKNKKFSGAFMLKKKKNISLESHTLRIKKTHKFPHNICEFPKICTRAMAPPCTTP